MRCPEHDRLRQLCEAAIRHWGHVLLSPHANLVSAPARQAAEIKRKMFEESNAAKERLSSHTLTYQTCYPRLKVIRKM
jgi:hypothetical protein